MPAERSVVTSVLKLTRKGSVLKELIRRDAKVTVQVSEETLRKLWENGLIRKKRGLVEASPSQRVTIAVQAIKLGADFEHICKFLEWTEFEGIAAKAFQANGFQVLRNFRFKQAGKRWEIDVLSCKEPLIVCIDCKHWQRRLSQTATVKAVEAQIERTHALGEALPKYYQKARLTNWKSATLIPLILSLVPGPLKFYNKVPIVPVLQLQDFINQLPLEIDLLTHFKKKMTKIERDLTDYSK